MYANLGINVKISLGIGMLTQEVTVPKAYQGITDGLLGNFDGDPANDFVFRNGSRIDGNSVDRDVFSFGQSCEFIIKVTEPCN